ncbi:hypothetical protein H6F67_08295 [Microcoleus sp. FACHB-1515]|uniref:hypothetical protein n=1 Tax=Cyanophyceae TaxID=3028117 RepID=UPI001688E7C1|nr:hypothetical protein [Microcoleus sp. FACHB-1515]MBD2089852.1 hypothetical protein [Microcoleus sp. FACHB-1515]
MRQSQIDRTAVNLRSRSFSNRDNSFATARDLGTFTSFSTQTSIRASGVIGRSDRKDVIKFTLAPGVSASSSSGRLIVRGGTLTYSLYGSVDGGRPQQQFTRRLPPGTYPFPSTSFDALPFSVTAYAVFDRPTGNVRYNYQESYRP